MKKIILFGFFILVIIFGCTREKEVKSDTSLKKEEPAAAQEKKEEPERFPSRGKENFTVAPLKENEHFEYEIKFEDPTPGPSMWDPHPELTKLFLYKVNNKEKELFIKIDGVRPVGTSLTSDKRNCFFLLQYNIREKNDFWCLDGNTGKASFILKMGDIYAISDDGEYIAISNAKYKNKDDPSSRSVRPRSILVVDIYNVNKKEVVYTIDYHDTVLKDKWGTDADIKYDSDKKSFFVHFEDEMEAYLSGNFYLDKMEFIADETPLPKVKEEFDKRY